MIELTISGRGDKIWINPRNITAVSIEAGITRIWVSGNYEDTWAVEESMETVINKINLYFLERDKK